MVDDMASREQVRDWIHEHPDQMRDLTIAWRPAEEPDPSAYGRLLEILFSPRPEAA